MFENAQSSSTCNGCVLITDAVWAGKEMTVCSVYGIPAVSSAAASSLGNVLARRVGADFSATKVRMSINIFRGVSVQFYIHRTTIGTACIVRLELSLRDRSQFNLSPSFEVDVHNVPSVETNLLYAKLHPDRFSSLARVHERR